MTTSLRITHGSEAALPALKALLIAAQLGSDHRDDELRFAFGPQSERVTMVAWHGEKAVATSRAYAFGPTGWIGNVAVHPDHRRQGLGRTMMDLARHWLEARGAAHIRLLATAMGRPLYESMGFVTEGAPYAKYAVPEGLKPLGPIAVRSVAIEQALALDRVATGEERASLLRPFAPRLVGPQDGSVGYGLSLPWGSGPIVAEDRQSAHALWWHLYGQRAGARWAVPRDNEAAAALARAYGLESTGESVRMRFAASEAAAAGAFRPEAVWAVWNLATG